MPPKNYLLPKFPPNELAGYMPDGLSLLIKCMCSYIICFTAVGSNLTVYIDIALELQDIACIDVLLC